MVSGSARFGRQWALAVVIGAAALLGFAKVGEDVFAHESTGFDRGVQAWVLAHQVPAVHGAFVWITTLGGIMAMRLLALAGAAFLWWRGHRRVSAGVLVVPVVADLLFHVAKRLFERQRPLGLGGRVDTSYSFPSGHATVSVAVCGALAYVFWREGLVGRSVALAFAVLVPLLVGASRVYLNVHWATDVLGGWCAGLVIAALSVALYDQHRRRRAVERGAPARSMASGA